MHTACLYIQRSFVLFTYNPPCRSSGNRTQKSDSAATILYSYAATSNRLTSAGGSAPGYDAMGNVLTDGAGRSFSYDATGRIGAASYGGSGASYTYDASGQRKTKAVSGLGARQTLFFHDAEGRLIGAYTPDGQGGVAAQEELVWMAGWQPIATVRAGIAYPILTDHQGAPRKVLDPATGTPLWSWDARESYGMQAPNEDVDNDGITFKLSLRMAGQWLDEETGLFHNNFRDYHPGLGRYIQSDPLGLEAGWNTYAYVGGDPVNGVDPWGLRDVLVKVWTGGAGHVYVQEMNGDVVVNQYPKGYTGGAFWPYAANETRTSAQSDYANRNEVPFVYKVSITDEVPFDAEAWRQRSKPWWGAPIYKDPLLTTNCVDAATNVLRAGGIDVSSQSYFVGLRHPIALQRSLNELSNHPGSKVTRVKGPSK